MCGWADKMDAHRLTDMMKLIANFSNFVDVTKHPYYGCIQKISLKNFYFLTADGSVGIKDMAKKNIILLCPINWFLADNGKCHLQH